MKDLEASVANLTVVLKGSDAKLTHIPAAYDWFVRKDPKTERPYEFGIAYQIPRNPRNVAKAETRTLKGAIRDGMGADQMGPIHVCILSQTLVVIYRFSLFAFEANLVTCSLSTNACGWLSKLLVRFRICTNQNMCTNAFVPTTSSSPSSARMLSSSQREVWATANLTGFNFSRKGDGNARSRSERTFYWKPQPYCHPARQVIAQQKEANAQRPGTESQGNTATENGITSQVITGAMGLRWNTSNTSMTCTVLEWYCSSSDFGGTLRSGNHASTPATRRLSAVR